MRRVPLSAIFILTTLSIYSLVSLYVLSGRIIYASKELTYILIGFFITYFIAHYDFRILKNFAFFIYGLTVISLIAVIVLGITVYSSKRWINIWDMFSLQPSEFAKIALIIVLAFVFSEDHSNNLKKFALATLLTVIIAGLIFIQPDLGSALVIGFIYLVFVVFSLPLKYTVLVLSSVVAMLPFLVKLLKPYQLERFLVFLNPQRDPLGSGYNVIQSIIAVGSGRLYGKGIAGSTMTRLNFVPVQYSDFIFSAIGEIFGFVGSLLLIVLFGTLLFSAINSYRSTNNVFGRGLAIGVFAMLFFQVMVNVGMCIGVMPVTGIPLPFVSYGGSSTITNFIAIGLMINVFIYKDEINLVI